MTASTMPYRPRRRASGYLGAALSAAADGATMTLCGAKTTKVECYQELGHDGLHCGLLAIGVERFADIFWSDDWHVDTALPWVTELPMEAEMPIFPVVVYSRGEDPDHAEDWTKT